MPGGVHLPQIPNSGRGPKASASSSNWGPGSEQAFRARMGVKPTWTGPVYAPESSGLTCAQCKQNVDPVSRIIVGTKYYHPRCLICCKCKTKSAEMYRDYQDKPICDRCAAAIPALRRPSREKQQKRVDAPEKCTACGQALLGQVMSALGGKYHPECFRCAGCGQGFVKDPQFVEKGGKPYHPQCVNSSAGPAPALGAEPACAACGAALGRQILRVPGRGAFHPECFVCGRCGGGLSGEFVEDAQSGKPLCVPCAKKK